MVTITSGYSSPVGSTACDDWSPLPFSEVCGGSGSRVHRPDPDCKLSAELTGPAADLSTVVEVSAGFFAAEPFDFGGSAVPLLVDGPTSGVGAFREVLRTTGAEDADSDGFDVCVGFDYFTAAFFLRTTGGSPSSVSSSIGSSS